MMIAAAAIGPNPPITMKAMPNVPPATCDNSQNGHENA
jgi:hypothetical protein